MDSVKTTALPLPRPSRPRSRMTRIASWNERAFASCGRDRARATKSSTRASSPATASRSTGTGGSSVASSIFLFFLEVVELIVRDPWRGWPASRRRSRAATFSRLAASAGIDDAMRR